MSGVKEPHIRTTLKKRTFNTGDIIQQVQEVLRTDRDDTTDFARRYPATREGLYRLYRDVYARITYAEDPPGYQWVQTPSYLWHRTRRGDCKSLTVFISSVLQNMGVRHIIRYTTYNRYGGKFTHVYPVALLNGQEIPLDVVYEKQEGGQIGTEKPYSRKKDYPVEPGLYKIGNVGLSNAEQQYVNDVERTVSEMEMAMADIPDSVITAGGGDITKMTKGQLDRQIWEDRFNIYAAQEPLPSRREKYRSAAVAMKTGTVAGIYGLDGDPLGRQVTDILNNTTSAAPAFKDFKLKLGNAPAPQISGLFQKVGDFFKKVGSKFKDLFNKFVNWIWKGPAKAMGPYFLFLFSKKNKVKSPEIRRRIAAQEKNFNYIAQKGKFDQNQLKGVLLNGIKEKTGADPKQLFSAAGDANRIGALPALLVKAGVWVVKAIGWVIQVIEKVVALFKGKKKEGGDISEATSSDVYLLEEEARLQREATTKTPAGGDPGTGGGTGGGGGILAALALGGAFLLKAA